ncbi:MAG: bifunctional [glutamine synthetase] adenylyltransferase/[glutamine synthetase]-adenylyl-L-tyrosine phosphorylase [Alphaproteobacteria bacterium]|nr:bifunctional [glutamine synthetase] adenylyltransferase/[glutamine synthetase]-adenylyl-L-tyrosine phosphorylase [Alphaproteobacteria bacterium]
MNLEQKNTYLLPKDHLLYGEWTEGLSELPRETALFFRTKAADEFVRRQLGYLNGTSPYLVRLILAEREFLAEIIQKGYRQAFAAVLKQTFSRLYGCQDMDTVGRELRLLKRRCALLIALADIDGQWDLNRVTHALSVLAEACVRIAAAAVLTRYHQKGDLCLPNPAEPEKNSGFFLIAMGKLGGRELNYSSDIDLIILFDEEKVPYAGKREIGSFFVRLTQEIIALLDDKTAYGYVFRTDLRLRPDPGSTPVALSTQAAACYYESFAQNWERAAFIKARVIAGDKAAGNAFLKEIKPFVWRRTTDFYALRQISEIKRSLGARSTETPDKAGFNVKLGQGGIREIEFFTQLQQLLWGGRDPRLRARGTLVALNALTKAGWVKPQDRQDLSNAYAFLRRLEHRLQMIDDQQTQTLPKSVEELDALARFDGFDNRQDFLRVLTDHCGRVRRIYDSLFAQDDQEISRTLSFSGTDVPAQTVEYLKNLGFENIDQIGETVRGWLSGRYRALRSDRARELMADLLILIFNALGKNENRDASFLAFDEFLRGLPAGVQLFSLFQSRPALLDLLAGLISTAPVLSRELTYHNELFDAVLSPSFFSAFPGAADLREEAEALLELAEDDEQALDAVRRFVREKKFRCAVLFLQGLMNKEDLGQNLSNLVTAVLQALCPVVLRGFEKRYGRFAQSSFSFVLLGKAGSAEMTFSSDLDILFVYDVHDGDAGSAGGVSSLSAGVYYARLAQRFVNALTANTKEGILWPVDMRLRPSGNAGPAAASFDSFTHYYTDSAWTWELMALTKARVVWGETEKMTAEIQKQLCRWRDPDKLKQDVCAMREKIRNQFRVLSVTDQIKYGGGGMIDIEFSAQYLQLKYAGQYPDLLQKAVVPVLTKAVEHGLIEPQAGQILTQAYRLWTLLSVVLSLCSEDAGAGWENMSASTIRLMCRFCSVENKEALRRLIEQTADRAASYRLF